MAAGGVVLSSSVACLCLLIHLAIYIVSYMLDGWEIEIEPEVRHWLDNLSDRDYLQAEHVAERLVDAPTTLSEPYARHLGDGLRELRFSLGHDGNAVRLTYWLAPDRRIVLLTVARPPSSWASEHPAKVHRARSKFSSVRAVSGPKTHLRSRPVGLVAVVHHDCRAHGREVRGGGGADLAATAGHQRDTSPQVPHDGHHRLRAPSGSAG